MSNKLILINGLGGSGKTTCGRLLSERIDSCAYFDSDMLTIVNPFEFGEDLIELGLRNAASLISNFFAAGYKAVVMSSGTGSQRYTDYLINLILSPDRVYWIWLAASKTERDKRRLTRRRDGADDPKWLDYVDGKVGPYTGPVEIKRGFCCEIDTDNAAPNDVVRQILEIIEHP
jgi:hypothetical protein